LNDPFVHRPHAKRAESVAFARGALRSIGVARAKKGAKRVESAST
jgi:hypothetical protein